MRKLILTCECGERMQVPRSALGKTGLCPSCSRAIPIRTDNTVPAPVGDSFASFSQKTAETEAAVSSIASPPAEEDKRRFGEAVDLYFARRYAEALAIFNGLAARMPDNPEIEMGRTLCLKAIQNRPAFAIEDKRRDSSTFLSTEDTVRQLLIHLMIHGSSEDIQLKAAELACRLLEISSNGKGTLSAPMTHTKPLLDSLKELQRNIDDILQKPIPVDLYEKTDGSPPEQAPCHTESS